MSKDLTSKNFKREVLESKSLVMVDFWAEWCGPCKAVAPILDEVEKELGDKLKVVKINIEKEENLANKYSVRSIPTFIFFKKGKVVEQISGAMDKKKMLKIIKKILRNL